MLTIVSSSIGYANDGVYRSSGGVLYPTQETSIRMKTEHLSFTCRDMDADVDVRFEFFNPEKEARKLVVGFQAPAASDPGGGDSTPNLIRDFRIMHGSELLPYRIMAAACADCPLQDTATLRFNFDQDGVFVYLFDLTFQPGINVVQHSYTFEASSGVMDEQSYNYILTTGAKWAGGSIHDLTVEIDMGSNTNFLINDIFGPAAGWTILGTGRVGKASESERSIRILSGKLQIHVSELSPTENIDFRIENSNCFSGYYGTGIMSERWHFTLCQRTLEPDYLDDDAPLTKADLRLLRNAIYAQYGLPFKDAELDTFFRQFEWYLADPNLVMGDILLTPDDLRFIEEILARERSMP